MSKRLFLIKKKQFFMMKIYINLKTSSRNLGLFIRVVFTNDNEYQLYIDIYIRK